MIHAKVLRFTSYCIFFSFNGTVALTNVALLPPIGGTNAYRTDDMIQQQKLKNNGISPLGDVSLNACYAVFCGTNSFYDGYDDDDDDNN